MQSFARLALLVGVLLAVAFANQCPRVREIGDFGPTGSNEYSFCMSPHEGAEGSVHLSKLFRHHQETSEVAVRVKDCYEVSVIFSLLENLGLGSILRSNEKKSQEVINFFKQLDKGVFCRPVATEEANELWSFNAHTQVFSFERESCPAENVELVQDILAGTIFQIVKLLIGNDILSQIPGDVSEITEESVKTILDFLAGCVRVYEVTVPSFHGCRQATANVVVPSSPEAIDFDVEKCVNGNGVAFNQEEVLEETAENIEDFVNAAVGEDVDAGPVIDAVLDALVNGDGFSPSPSPSPLS